MDLFAALGRYPDADHFSLGIGMLGQDPGFFICRRNLWRLRKENQVKENEAC